MSKFTRDVIANSQAIREELSKILQEELIENDEYLQQIQDAAKPINDTSFSSSPENVEGSKER